MRMRFMIPLALLPLVLACTSSTTTDGTSYVNVTLQGQYQDRDPATGTVTVKPIRYGYAELVDAGSGQTLASGYLGANGVAYGSVEAGRSFYLRISAAVEVPDAAGTGVVLRGSVKNAALPASFANLAAFDAIPDVTVTSDTVSAGSSGTLAVTAIQDAQQRAASFNAADQMVTYALGVRAVEPGLKLPNLHAFWTNTTESTGVPAAVRLPGNLTLTKNGRAVFALPVAGDNSLAANANSDLYDDGELLQAYAHQLFGPYSYPETGASAGSIIRNDTDTGTNDRSVQSEASMAFQAGFCDFLSGAFRKLNGDPNPQRLVDSYISSGGTATYAAFDLTRHDQFSRVAGQGEFYRGSVAISLWNTWNIALGGSTPSLQTLWTATLSQDPNGGYLNTQLGCYPTYLVGLRTALGFASTAWNNTLTQLSLEDVPNPDATYFAGTALWTPVSTTPFSDSGGFPTYASGIAFERNQAKAYRFYHGGGARTITLSTSSPGLVLDLIDSVGLYGQATANTGANGVLNYTLASPLPAGYYLVRVRIDPFVAYANGTANWSLSIN
jgi:hypothetical protein